MGYCETMCQLCGVTFAIARLRRADEPEQAAWIYYGSDFITAGDDCSPLCGEGSGCTISDNHDRAEEHLAGPGCVCDNGYSGHRISLAEMKGCRAVQCLVKKEPGWMPEDGDQDFEIEGDYFLTGIGDGSPDESALEDIQPVRHGVDSIIICNTGEDPEFGLPFHPTCFEIFKKVCEIRIGRIDIEGLVYWRYLECDYDTFFTEFPRDPAVRSGSEQWWKHEPGNEYLVANPIDIPDLSLLLQPPTSSAIKKTTFDYGRESDESNTAQDPFSTLSAEITSMILDHLGSKDIANLRLATPAFRQLPTILFRRLLLEDMPWLFEVKDLNVASVDWYDWYCKWKSCHEDVKGLRNRMRIWRDVEEIVKRIQMYRKEGKVHGL